jgi:hypothetical protein
MITVVAAAMTVRAPCISFCPLILFYISFVSGFPTCHSFSLSPGPPTRDDRPSYGRYISRLFSFVFHPNTTHHNPVFASTHTSTPTSFKLEPNYLFTCQPRHPPLSCSDDYRREPPSYHRHDDRGGYDRLPKRLCVALNMKPNSR